MKFILRLFAGIILMLSFCVSYCQMGINTENPHPSAGLEISSDSLGFLIPRVQLSSDLLSQSPVNNPASGLLVFNTGMNQEEGLYFWYNNQWNKIEEYHNILYQGETYSGKILIKNPGNFTVSGLPFKPEIINFDAYANINNENIDGPGSGINDHSNYSGGSHGYAINKNGSVEQQCVHSGGSGDQIKDISRYSSSTECIGLRYAKKAGNNPKYISASLTSFNDDGFTLNVNNAYDSLLVCYSAHRISSGTISATNISYWNNLKKEDVTDINFTGDIQLIDGGNGTANLSITGSKSRDGAELFQSTSTNTTLNLNPFWGYAVPIPWDQTIFISNNCFTHSNSTNNQRIVCKKTGLYRICFKISAEMEDYELSLACYLKKNDASIINESITYINSGFNYQNASTFKQFIISLNENDFLEAFAQRDGFWNEIFPNAYLIGPNSTISLQFLGNASALK